MYNMFSCVQCFWLVLEVLLVKLFLKLMWNICTWWYLRFNSVSWSWIFYFMFTVSGLYTFDDAKWRKPMTQPWRKTFWRSFVWDLEKKTQRKSRTKQNDESFAIDRPWWLVLFCACLKRRKHKNAEGRDRFQQTLWNKQHWDLFPYSLWQIYTPSSVKVPIESQWGFTTQHTVLYYT